MNREPLAIRAAAIWAIQSIILTVVAFGWNLTGEQIAASFTAVSAVSALAVVVWTRGKVTPVDDPRIEGVGAYAPPVDMDDAA